MGDALARLLWITGRYPPQKGGMAVSCERLVRGARKSGAQVDVIAFTNAPGVKRFEEIERDRGVDVVILREPSPGNAAQLAWTIARRRMARDPYNAVIGFGANYPGFVAVTCAAWLALPSLIMVRGNDFDRDWFEPRRGHYVREALSRADLIGAVSPDAVSRIKSLIPGANARWTPNGVDPAFWELLPKDRELRDITRDELARDGIRIIGMFGEMKFKKRAPFFLGALRDAGLKDKVSLLMVGKLDEETDQVLSDPVLAPRSKRMSFTGREELPGLYAACDYVAVPSLFEGMPNALLEAMACGAVPIVSDAGAMAEVVEHGVSGFVFAAEDRLAAARVAGEALSLSAGELGATSERARERVAEHFTIERELDTLLGLIDSLGG